MKPRFYRALAMMESEGCPLTLCAIFPGSTQNAMPKLIQFGWARCTTALQPGPAKFEITDAGRTALIASENL